MTLRERRRTRMASWLGWILPLAALALIVVLVWSQAVARGPEAVVHFYQAQGLAAGSAVVHDGVPVGRVERVELEPGWDRVAVHIRLHEDAAHALKAGTQFWIEGGGRLGSLLPSFLGATSLAVQPGEGEATDRFEGLEGPPAATIDRPGVRYQLVAEDRGSVGVGSPVLCRGFPVGTVRAVALADDREEVRIEIVVWAEHADHVHQETRFWRLSAVDISREGGGLEVKLPALPMLAAGGIALRTPRRLAGSMAEPGSRFELHDSYDRAMAVALEPGFDYRVIFDRPLVEVERGSAVHLMGVEAGQVAATELLVDGAGPVRVAATLRLDPETFGIRLGPETSRSALRRELDRRLATLVARGLRVQLDGGMAALGGGGINLVMRPEAEAATLQMGHQPPILPSAADAAGIHGLMTQAEGIMAELAAVPYAEIGTDVAETASAARTAIDDLQRLSEQARGRLGPLIEELQPAIVEARQALAGIADLVGGNRRVDQDLPGLIGDIQLTAAAVRDLAELLSRQPESLLTGRN